MVEQRERAPTNYNDRQLPAVLAEIRSQIEGIDLADEVRSKAYYHRQRLRQRALKLARARVLDFIGEPNAQMQLAASLCEHCCCCFKALTDRISLERGIGPDCLAKHIDFIRMHAASKSVEWISFWSGMPREYVTDVMNEQAAE